MCDGAASGLPIAPRLYSADRQADTAAARRFVGWRRATSVAYRLRLRYDNDKTTLRLRQDCDRNNIVLKLR